jgi:hypothetical protein
VRRVEREKGRQRVVGKAGDERVFILGRGSGRFAKRDVVTAAIRFYG